MSEQEPVRLAAPPGGAAQMNLELAGSLSGVLLSAGHELRGASLLEARMQGSRPRVRLDDDQVTMALGRRWWPGKAGGRVALSPRVAWRLRLSGGVDESRAELSELRLLSLELGAGVSGTTVSLPPPRGTVAVRVYGEASRLQIERPEGVPVRLRLWGGASALRLDAQRIGSETGPLCIETPGYGLAINRYEIELHGGADQVGVLGRAAAAAGLTPDEFFTSTGPEQASSFVRCPPPSCCSARPPAPPSSLTPPRAAAAPSPPSPACSPASIRWPRPR